MSVHGAPVKIHNTLTRAKEELIPLTAGQVRMYVCGVTVYDVSHIGHARSAIVFDVIRRYLSFKGYRVRFVKNYTDVDDKIIKRANEEAVDAATLSNRYIAAYEEDMAALGVGAPDVAPKATDHIAPMLALIERLLAGGFAYAVDGDVYFEISRFPRYGRLSGKNLDELLAGARVEVDERKRDARDFALWKAAKPGEPSWPSPWGPGRPGWHIECSAMAMRYLGESFDVHGGGEDLIFPHHECEIAQSEAATGKPFARYWIHNGFVNFGAEKMSKSLGNVLTIRELVKRHDPDALRWWLLGTHYRSPLEFSEDKIREAARALARLWGPVQQAAKHRGAAGVEALPALAPQFAGYREAFEQAMDDDFNTPKALGVLFELSHALNRAGPAQGPDFVRGARELSSLGTVLGFSGGESPDPIDDLPVEVRRHIAGLMGEREAARARRDWRRADEIRAEIEALGLTVEDTPAGAQLKRKAR